MHYRAAESSGGMFTLEWWVLDLGDDVKLLVSDGHGMGSMALVQLVPSEDLDVVCVMNTRKNDSEGRPLTRRVATRAIEAISLGFASKLARFREDRARIDKVENLYRPMSSLLGRWRGFVQAFDGSRTSIELLFQQDGDIHVTLEDQYTVLLNEPRYRNGILAASFPGYLPVDVPYDQDHTILARILFDRDQAHGYLIATFDDQRGEFDLSSYLHLERDPSSFLDGRKSPGGDEVDQRK